MPTLTVIPSNLQVDVTKHHIDWDQIDEDRIIVAAFNSNDLSDLAVYFTIGAYDVTTETWSFSPWKAEILFPGIAPNVNRQIGIQTFKGTDGSRLLFVLLMNGHNVDNSLFPSVYSLNLNETLTELLSINIVCRYDQNPFANNQIYYNALRCIPARKFPLFKRRYFHTELDYLVVKPESYAVNTNIYQFTATKTALTLIRRSLLAAALGASQSNVYDFIGSVAFTVNAWGADVTTSQVCAIFTAGNGGKKLQSMVYTSGNTANDPWSANNYLPYCSATSKMTEICRLSNNYKIAVNGNILYNAETNDATFMSKDPIIGTVIKSYQLHRMNNLQGVIFTSGREVKHDLALADGVWDIEDYTIKAPLHMYRYTLGTDSLDSRRHFTHFKYLGPIWDKASPYIGRTHFPMVSSDQKHVFVIAPLTKTDTVPVEGGEDNETQEVEKLVFGILDVKLVPEDEPEEETTP